MGKADFLRLGDYNAQCYRCGMKRKASEMKKQWQGYYVCPEHWEQRQPQDFVKAIPDEVAVPWSQPLPGDTFVYVCDPNGQTAIPARAIPGCVIPNYISPSYDPSIPPGS